MEPTLKNLIHYIGKKSNKLEQSEVLGVSKNDTMEYVNFQKKLRKIIEINFGKSIRNWDSRSEWHYLKKLQDSKMIKLKKRLEALKGKTPTEEAMIKIDDKNRWKTII